MKIAAISDLHLGFRQYGSLEREEDFYQQFSKVCNEINKYNPNIVIIAGDLFNQPNPSPIAINAYREGIGSLNADIICVIKGNHTMILRDNHYSIDEFFSKEEFEEYYYLDDKSMTSKDFAMHSQYDNIFSKYIDTNVQIDGITYRYNSDIEEFLDVQHKMAKNCTNDMYNILVVHQSFKEFCGFTGEELSIEDIDYSKYNVIICGHIHSRFHTKLQNGTWFVQPGSIERMNTTEALDEQKNGKGFYIIDTVDNSVEFHKVECCRKFFLGDINIDTKEKLQKHLEELDDDIRKLKVPPIISYNYHNNIQNNEEIRNKIGLMKNDILLNKSNIYDNVDNEIVLEITDKEMPTVLEAIKMYGEKAGLTKKDVTFACDLHEALNNNIDSASGLIEDYYKENKKTKEIVANKDEDIDELIRYFEELEV